MFGWRPLRRVGSSCLLLLAVGTAAGGHGPAGATTVLAGVWAPPAIAPLWQAMRPWMEHLEREVAKVDDFVDYVLDDTVGRLASVDEHALVARARAAWSSVREAMEPASGPGSLAQGAAGTPLEQVPAAGTNAMNAAEGNVDLPVSTRGMGALSGGPGGPPEDAQAAEPADERQTAPAAARPRPRQGDDDGASAATASGREPAGDRGREEARWQEGVASWYGPGFYGRPTASGEIFTGRDFTAAHRTLPFGTLLRVHYPVTGQTVEVRINDRGPFIAGRDLDLAEAAARALGMISAGVARVRYQVIGRAD